MEGRAPRVVASVPGAFVKAAGALADPAMRRPVWASLAAALFVFALLWAGVGVLLAETTLLAWGWLEAVVDLLGGLATLAITWFLFPAVASSVLGLLAERIAATVEARHYPGLPAARGQGVGEIVAAGLRFLGLMAVVNLGVLAFVLVPPVFPFVFYGANGYLLGREYFELVALRRIGPTAAAALRKAHRGDLLAAGVIIAFLFTVPVVNVFAPVIATAAMVHLFEGWRNR